MPDRIPKRVTGSCTFASFPPVSGIRKSTTGQPRPLPTPLLRPRPRVAIKVARPKLHAARPCPISWGRPQGRPPIAADAPRAAPIATARPGRPRSGVPGPSCQASPASPTPKGRRPPSRKERAPPTPRPAEVRRRRGRWIRSPRAYMPTRKRVRTAAAGRGAHLAGAGVRAMAGGGPRETTETRGPSAAVGRTATAA